MSPNDLYLKDYLHPDDLEKLSRMLLENEPEVRERLRVYIEACSKTDQTREQLDVLKRDWYQACVPNTDTERTYAFYADCTRLENELRYNDVVQEEIAYEALFP
jgi:hypothetical protein